MQSTTLKERSRSTLAARAKVLHTAHLEWLEGFPLAPAAGTVSWMAVPAHAATRELCIERQHLSQATFAINKLRIELAPAVDRLADEPQAWLASIERRLELLKRAIHRGEPLPPQLFDEPSLSRARREQISALVTAEPRLRALLQALSWIHAGHPARLKAALDQIGSYSPGFVLLADRLGELPALLSSLRFLQLAADHGSDRVQALADSLFDERTYDVALDHGQTFCVQILGAISKRPTRPLPDAPPRGTLGRELARWCEDLVQQNRRSQRRALRLFSLATPLPLIGRWAHWWQTAQALLNEARKMKALPYERESRHRLREELEQHGKSVPPPLATDDLLAALREQTTSPDAARASLLERALALIPDDATTPGRTQLFIYWTFLGADDGTPPARIHTLLAGFERYLTRKPIASGALLQPWREVAASSHGWNNTPELDLLESGQPKRTILAAYDHLASVAALQGGLDPDGADKAIELFFLAGDSALAAGLFESLRTKNRLNAYDSPESSKLALRLCRDRPERFADVLRALDRQEIQPELPPSEWPESVIGPLSSGELGEFVRESIATRQWTRLLVCATKASLLAAADLVPLPQTMLAEAAVPDWLQRYPAQLQPVLRRLAAVLNDAEAKVAKWLVDDFPDAGRLQREISVLELRLEQADEEGQPALRTRLDNLRARFAQPAIVGTARLHRLTAKLDRAWGRALLERWEREIDSHLPAALQRLLDIADVPPWLREPRHLSLLALASPLRRSHRRLANRLFRLRCGPPPWDLRDAPENRLFIDRLPQVDWRPWIDGMGTIAATAADGRPLQIALEDDPLEIFRMGAHFKTCLSPGGMNYFSVFSNAADINKRVLFARDESGKVVGRCLLALTAKAELLTFHAYCHDGKLGFEKICGDFADQLASRMGIRRIARGRVPLLVASDWYDDGPRDLGRRFPGLEESSPLRRRLATVRPGELLDELGRALKPARLDDTTIPLILELPELAERPELIVPLLRRVAECRTLPREPLATAAHLGLRAGASDLVRRLLLPRLLQFLRPSLRFPAWADPRAVEVVLRLDPARLLAVLRQTRPLSVRDWVDETEGIRLYGVAAALEALYRPRQARPLWQRLATSLDVNASDEQRQHARSVLGGSV
jgi:hypothetical protein